LAFLGRIDEPRKGLKVLLEAFESLLHDRPGLRLLVAGPGDIDQVRTALPPRLVDRITFLGLVSEEDKARMLATADVYVAPNLGGESFGIILLEAMAAGAPVLASDLDAFERVLDGGRSGVLFRTGDPADLAAKADELLGDPALRAEMTERGNRTVQRYDWRTVAKEIVAVYEMVARPGARVGALDAEGPTDLPTGLETPEDRPERLLDRVFRRDRGRETP
jgi:phosphatidylinositol alpha-mannosyltransferase